MRRGRTVTRTLLVVVLLSLSLGLLWLGSAAGLGSGDSGAGDSGAGERPRVLATRIEDSITPVIADQVHDGLERAVDGSYNAYVIELDTPGGLVDAMRDIVGDILASPLPVIVYVSPEGARAGSAGAIITLASHVAVMAPGTTIGAATPVGLGGEDLSAKIVNDATAQAAALARLRDRDVDLAVAMVREGEAVTVEEAVDAGLVDAQATTLADALLVADGRVVTVSGQREVTVRTADAEVERYDLGLLREILQFLADPNVAFLLLMVGMLGLIFEMTSPGVGIGGTIGALALLLALFSLSVLPVDAAGLLLLGAAIALFIAEVLVPGFGGFAAVGGVALVLSALFLFDDAEGVSVDLWAAVPLAVLVLAAAVVVGRLARRTRHEPSRSTGTDVFTGRWLDVRSADGTTGTSYAEGAWWSLRSVGAPLIVGNEVPVVGVDGLVLLVDPDQDRSADDGDPGATRDAGPSSDPRNGGKDTRDAAEADAAGGSDARNPTVEGT
ncbi:MAG: NfeD family protein [Nocardioidaceae bacterium]